MIQRDDYGLYEEGEGFRRYKRTMGEVTERRVTSKYPQAVSNKNPHYKPYRNFLVLPAIEEEVRKNSKLVEDTDILDHILDAKNYSLPLPVRRMHFDIIGSIIWEFDKDNNALALWKSAGGY